MQQEDLSPQFLNLDGSYRFPALKDLDHTLQVLADAGIVVKPDQAVADFKSGTMNGDGLGDYALINPSTPGERQIPTNSYYAILKGPRSQRQSDCWIVWDPKPPAAAAVQFAFGYSPQNYTDAMDMSAVALDPSQSYTMRIFSQGNRPWGCLFQKLVVYQTTDKKSPLPDVTETHAPTIDSTGAASGSAHHGSGSNTGALVGGVVGGVAGGLLLAALIVGCCWWRNRRKGRRGHSQQVSLGSDMTHRTGTSGAPVLRRWGSHTTVESLATSLDSQSNYGDDRTSYPDMPLDDAVLPSQSPNSTSTSSPRPQQTQHLHGAYGTYNNNNRAPSARTQGTQYSQYTQYTNAPSHSSFGSRHVQSMQSTTSSAYEHTTTSYNSVRPSSEYENQQAMLTPSASGRRLI